MKAAFIKKTGPPQAITYGDLPKPKPEANQVLIKVEAATVNPVDTYIRSGTIAMDLPMPYIVGCDVAGTVEAVGSDVKRFQPGARVWGSNQGLLGRQGTTARFVAVDECWLYPTPDDVESRDAAAISLVGITAHLGLFRYAQLGTGDTLFVNGGTGGVGSCVVQMGRAIGARVIATAGSDEKVSLARELGADLAINYKTTDVDAAIRRFAPDGIDVWYETLREQDLERTVGLMNLGGRIILMAGRDSKPRLPVGSFYTRDMKIFGFAMFNAPAEEQRKCAAEINRWMARKRLRPIIGEVMKFKDTAEAHRIQEAKTLQGKGSLTGKIVLVP